MTITVTGMRQHQAWAEGRLPPVEQVRPGLWSIPVPFPDPRTRYTLSYLLQSEGMTVLIDPGMDTSEGWTHLLRGLEEAGASPRGVDGIIATHCHPDHLGLAERLRAASGAWLAMGAEERYYRPEQDFAAAAQVNERRLLDWGVPPTHRSRLSMTEPVYQMMRALARPDIALQDGEHIRVGAVHLEVVATPGHSPGHICLLDRERNLIISGDHLLPGIRPHVMLDHAGLSDPLESYLSSLLRTRVDPGIEVLPAHEYRYTGADTRSCALELWHERRAEEIIRVAESLDPQSLWSLTSGLGWARGWEAMDQFAVQIALGETASHLVRLRNQGETVPKLF